MNIENMEQEFPKMPQSMRDMIEKEVEKQVKVTPQRGYFSLKKAVVASLAATFVLGTTIFAGTKLYRMSSSPQGNYGMTTKIEKRMRQKIQKNRSGTAACNEIILSAGWNDRDGRRKIQL